MKRKLFTTLVLFASLALTACGAKPADDKPVSSKAPETSEVHKHKYGDWTQTKAPTCEVAGEEERVCACGEKQTREVKALGHDWDEGTVTKEATCSVPGEKTFHCKRAGCTATKVEPVLAAHDLQPVSYTPAEGEVNVAISKCSKDEYYEIKFDAFDANAVLNNSGDRKTNYVKLSKQVASDGTGTASYIEWKIHSPKAMKGRFWIDITGNTSNFWDRSSKSGAQALFYTYDDSTTHINTWKNKVELNGAEVDFDNAKYKVGEEDIPFAELVYSDFGELASSSGTPISVPMPEVDLVEGENVLRFTRLTGYAFNMHTFTFKANI